MTLPDQSSEQSTTQSRKRDPLIGTEVAARYELVSLLGRGATTSVYKANDKVKNRFVAVKILRTDSIFNEQLIRRFEQECKTLGLLKHRNIVQLYDSGVNDADQPFLVMEYVDGISLKELIEVDDRIDFARTLKIFIQICAALAAAHEKGIVHRDMKPANIMLMKNSDGEEQVKILDFGVAKLLVQGDTFQTKTQTGEMLGTLLYMSPEQCLEQVLDERCDVYSVGCVLYETLTGKPPLIGRTAFETMNKHLTQMPEKLSKVRPDRQFDDRFDVVLRIAMAKEAKDRYQTIGEFQSALSAILARLDDSPRVEPPSSTPTEATPQVPENKPESANLSVPQELLETVPALNSELPPKIAINLVILVLWGIFACTSINTALFFPVSIICFFAIGWNSLFNNLDAPVRSQPERRLIAVPKPTGDDTSRDGTIYFLAMESRDGVAWKNIYADQIAQYNIKDSEVSAMRTRLIAAHHDAWTEVKAFVMKSFDKIDADKDGFISKAELKDVRAHSNPHLREHALLSFLITNLEDIQNIVNSGESSAKGVRRQDLSEYFLHLERIEKEGL
ncbi:MAG: protein kinase [Candidatus Obscuribacterales bacterium]